MSIAPTSRFWVLPTVCCALALVAGLLLPELDEALAGEVPLVFGGGPGGARSLLSSITTAMISVTGLVFSITVVVLQLASSQFSPRVLRTFLDSRITRLTLGVFTGTFLYAVVVLRSVRGGDGTAPFVPQLAVTGAFVLVVASVALFIAYIHSITQSIRVVTIIGSTGDATRRALHRLEERPEATGPASPGPPAPVTAVVVTTRSGVVVSVDAAALLREAQRCDGLLALNVRIGDHVVQGMTVATLHGATDQPDESRVRAALHLDRERSPQWDVAFGLRQLVDIAERALSPGINDPTTATQALDEIHDLLRRLATRPDPQPAVLDAAGTPRVLLHEPGFADHLDLGLDEIAHYGRDGIQVLARITRLLDDLATAACPEHRAAIAAKRHQLDLPSR